MILTCLKNPGMCGILIVSKYFGYLLVVGSSVDTVSAQPSTRIRIDIQPFQEIGFMRMNRPSTGTLNICLSGMLWSYEPLNIYIKNIQIFDL